MKSQDKRRRSVSLLAILVVACGVLAVGTAEAKGGGFPLTPPAVVPPLDDAEPPTTPQDPPPHPPGHAQGCMDNYLKNLNRCMDACCFDLLFIWHIACDDACLLDCYNNAEETFDQCMQGH